MGPGRFQYVEQIIERYVCAPSAEGICAYLIRGKQECEVVCADSKRSKVVKVRPGAFFKLFHLSIVRFLANSRPVLSAQFGDTQFTDAFQCISPIDEEVLQVQDL